MDDRCLNLGNVSATSVSAPAAKRKRQPSSVVGANSSAPIFLPSPKLRLSCIIDMPDRMYRLKSPFVFDLEDDGSGSVRASHRTLPIVAFGATAREAVEEFNLVFDMQYRALVGDKGACVPSAQRHAEEFERLVEEVVVK